MRPAEWRPDLDNPLRTRREHDGDDEPVLKLVRSEPAEGDRGAPWHLCGVGIKDQP